MNERPLVAFTVLTQLGVGTFLAIVAIGLGAGGLVSQASIETLTNRALLVSVPIVVAGLLLSLLHLGTPGNAWRALTNARTSWLSRELLLALTFVVLACLSAVLRWLRAGSSPERSAVAIAAGVTGVALVYAMARVYRLRTVPGWDTPLTTVSFFATTLLLGTLAAAALISLLPGVPDAMTGVPLTRAAFVAATCFAVEIAIEERGTPHELRRIMLLVGLVFTGLYIVRDDRAPRWLLLAFSVAIVTQTIGRHRFYLSGLRRTL